MKRKNLLLALVFIMASALSAIAVESYAVYTPSDNTLTFYHDNLRATRPGTPYDINTSAKPAWSEHNSDITNVVFNLSFANARPKTTLSWFSGMEYLISITGLDYLNTSEVTSMASMFSGCKNIKTLDLRKFNTSKVVNMSFMFSGCSSLTDLNVSSFNTSQVITMGYMFNGCSSIPSLNLSNFNTSKVTNMEFMFYACRELANVNVSSFNTGEVTKMNYMFCGCKQLSSIDVSKFNTEKVTAMGGMFADCNNLTDLNVSSFNTSNAVYMGSLFSGCEKLTSINVSNFNTSKATTMEAMFWNCKNLASIDVSNFNTENVTDMSSLFQECRSLTSLNLSNFNTSKVTDMAYMFSNCQSLTSITFGSNFNTENVTKMSYMFQECSSLTSLNLKTFNTEKVTNMSTMFYNCSSLTSLDLSSFKTSKVTNMSYMFSSASNLATITVSDKWTTTYVTNSDYMFRNAKKLMGQAGTAYDESHVDKEYARIDYGAANPGYLTDKDNDLIYHEGLWYRIEVTSSHELRLMAPQYGNTYSGDVVIPKSFVRNGTTWKVTCIDEAAFTGTNVTSIEVPSTVTSIGAQAFYGAKNLKTLVLLPEKAPNKYTLLGDDFVGNNATGFTCYVKNSTLLSWMQSYTFTLLPWVMTNSENGYLTFSCVLNITLPEGVTAYRVTGFNTSKRMATTTKLTNSRIPSKTGVILKGEPGTRYLLTTATTTSNIGDNMLHSFLAVEDIPYAPFATTPDDTKAYFLGNSCVEWYQFQNSIDLFMVLDAGIAYLVVDKSLLGNDYTSPVKLDLWTTVSDYPRGDVNGDYKVDVEDVNAVINIILEQKTCDDYPGNADIVGGDNKVDIEDVNEIINIILSH